MKKTYFILSRKIFESAIWRDDPHILKLFIYLVGMARHQKTPQSYPDFKISRGELVTSLHQISENNEYLNKGLRKWSSGKVSRMLHKLQEQGYIELLADTYGTHVKICNYDAYQDTKQYGANSCEKSANSCETVVETFNNDNNDKNDKNEYIPPCTLKEFQNHFIEYAQNRYSFPISTTKCKDYAENSYRYWFDNEGKEWKKAGRKDWKRTVEMKVRKESERLKGRGGDVVDV